MHNGGSEESTFKVPGYILLGVGCIIVGYPFVWMFTSSFLRPADIMRWPPTLIPKELTFTNYLEVFDYVNVMRAFLNSVIVSVGITVSQLLFCSIVGYSLARLRYWGREAIFYLILSTMMIPFYSIVIPLFLVVKRLDLVGTHLGIMFPALLSAFSIFLFRQHFVTIPFSLSKAARVDGCSELSVLFRVIIPLSKPIFVTVGILTFLSSWNMFMWPLIVAKKMSLRTLPIIVSFFQMYAVTSTASGGRYGALMALCSIVGIPVLLLYAFFQKWIIQGMTMSGIKG